MSGYLIDRPARLAACPSCGHPALTAIAGGITVKVDPQHLTVTEEIAALLSGGRTYDVVIRDLPRRMYFEWRSLTRIKAGRRYPVVADHVCPALFNPDPVPEMEITFPYDISLPDFPPF